MVSTNLSDEELIELAKLAKPVPVKIEDTHDNGKRSINTTDIEEFILFLGLKPGKNKTRSSELYNAYCSYSINPANKTKFGREFSKFFDRYHGSGGSMFKINLKLLTIHELIQERKNEKSNKTQQSEIPRINEDSEPKDQT